MDASSVSVIVVVMIIFVASYYFSYSLSLQSGIAHYKNLCRERLSDAFVVSKARYDPFEIARHVSLRAGIAPLELFCVSDCPGNAKILFLGGKKIIVYEHSLLFRLSAQEFECLVAHEIGHIFDGRVDSFLENALNGFLLQSVFLLGFCIGSSFLESTPDTFALSLSFATIFLSMTSLFLQRFFKRRQEFIADRKGLSLTRFPESFVRFLLKVTGGEKPVGDVMSAPKTQVRASLRKSAWASFVFDTHPPVRERIKVIEKILKKKKQRAKK